MHQEFYEDLKNTPIQRSPQRAVYPIVIDEPINQSIKECEDKSSVLNTYIESQRMSLTKEIVVPSLREFKTERRLFDTPKIKNCQKDLRKINVKHENDGIMRRNRLLIEHILYQRMQDKCSILNALTH